jgi:predicted membrane protein
MKKIVVVFFMIIVLVAVGYIAVFGRALKQQENHVAIAKVLREAFLSPEAIRVDNETLLARDLQSFKNSMIKEGFTYEEQMGASHVLRKEGRRYMSTSRMYSSHFMLFSYPVRTSPNK